VRNPRDASAICICTRQLKLGRMRDTLPERLILAREQHLSHAASLELVLADEATRRHPLGGPPRRDAGLDAAMRLVGMHRRLTRLTGLL
jgi:hypothetical protein